MNSLAGKHLWKIRNTTSNIYRVDNWTASPICSPQPANSVNILPGDELNKLIGHEFKLIGIVNSLSIRLCLSLQNNFNNVHWGSIEYAKGKFHFIIASHCIVCKLNLKTWLPSKGVINRGCSTFLLSGYLDNYFLIFFKEGVGWLST